MLRVFIIGLLFLAPLTSLAAGFAKESLFLSTANPIEGETVLIHAIVSNETSGAFAGEISFAEGKSALGSVPVALSRGEARVFSISWLPGAGSHTLVATLTEQSGTAAGEVTQTFSVAAKITQSSAQQISGGVDSSLAIQEQISDISPAVGNVLSPGFAIVDSARSKAVGAIDSGVDWAKAQVNTKPSGNILGSQTIEPNTFSDTARFIAATILLYVLSVLRWVVASAGVFYPALVILFFYGLWRLYQRMRTPRWR